MHKHLDFGSNINMPSDWFSKINFSFSEVFPKINHILKIAKISSRVLIYSYLTLQSATKYLMNQAFFIGTGGLTWYSRW